MVDKLGRIRILFLESERRFMDTPFKKSINHVQARQLLEAWESGMIDDDCPDLEEAGRVLGRRPIIKVLPTIANPQALFKVRTF